jgi:hypothetical protein
MGVAYFIVLDRKIEGLDTGMDGKLLARAAPSLDALATELRVRPLSGFISVDPEQAADFLESEGTGNEGADLPPLRQFPAPEGLATVRALAAHLRARPAAVKETADVLQDLGDCERILNAAAQHGVKWHLEVDF